MDTLDISQLSLVLGV